MKPSRPHWLAALRKPVPPPGPDSPAAPAPGPDPRHIWWRVIGTLVAIVAVAGTIAKFRPEIDRLRELESRAAALLDEEESLEAQLAEVGAKHRWLREDPVVVEAAARDRLDLRRPGETVFRISPSGGEP